MRTETLIVGGGPAGMMAACTAAQQGQKVLLLEKNGLLGRKLRITGKGRCNLTNNCTQAEFLQNIPTNPKFLYSAISRFTPQDTMAFFESRGVLLKTERGRRVFPQSDKAADVANALADACREAGVSIREGQAESLLTGEGRCIGVKLADGASIFAERVVLATGGSSYPLTGSTGDGYRLAQEVGHTITPIRPSLVPLESEDADCRRLQGLSLRNVEAVLWDRKKGKAIYRELGEMLFTHFGLSGPLVLSASAHIPQMEKDRYELRIDLKPGLSEEKLDSRLLRDFTEFANRDFANSLEKLLPRKLIAVVVARSGISPDKKVNQIGREERQRLCGLLKRFTVSLSGFRPIDEAIITAGGVKVSEVDPKTMESKKLPGLYFAGEILDVDGYTGGYNLQIAFSTGFCTGSGAGAAQSRKE